MQVASITNNNYNSQHTSFKAGKIKVLNPQIWTDAELKAFARNDEFKALANQLKKKKLDLFVSLDEIKDKVGTRVLNLFSGKDETNKKLIQKIVGPIWNCTPEKRSLIDNIALFPQNIETLFNRSDSSLTKEKEKIVKELEKKKIIIRDLNYWHLSELKALNANKDVARLTKRPDLEGAKIHFIRDYSDFLNGNYIEVYHECSNIGSIYPKNYSYNNSSTITDAIANFEDFLPISSEDSKEQALFMIEKFNEQQDLQKKSVWYFIKGLFSAKAK